MKKLVIIFLLFVGLLPAQNGNHIHHLFGLKEDAQGFFSLEALDQKTGNSVEIENFSLNFELGGSFSYSKQSSDVFYLDSASQISVSILYGYRLPDLYSSSYQGSSGTFTLQGGYLDFVLGTPQDSSLYMLDFNQKVLIDVDANNFSVGQTSQALTAITDENTLSMAFFNDVVYVSSYNANTDSTSIYFVETNNLQIINFFTVPYQFAYLTADPTLGVYGIVQDYNQQHFLFQLNSSPPFMDVRSDTLPSCVDCANDIFTYDKNALAIDSDNSQIILSRTEETNSVTTYYLSSFDLSSGTDVKHTSTLNRWSNLIFQKPMADLVYPGDANHDKEVNMLDLLPIGLKYNDILSPRTEISVEWIGQDAINSGDSLANGVDSKHADCNGDGQVNVLDVDNAVLVNYGYQHYSEKGTSALCDFPLYISYPSLVKEGEDVQVEIGLDLTTNIAQEIYGMVFRIEYDTNFVINSTMNTEGVNTWFGTENLNYIQRNLDDYPSGRMDVGVTGIDKLNRDGGGVLINGVWSMEDDVIPIAQGYDEMNFKITNVFVIDFDENVLDACGLDTLIRVYDKTVGIVERSLKPLEIYPNPSKNHFINLSNVDNLDLVEVYDLHGKLLHSASSNFEYINISALAKGVYIVKAYAGSTEYVNKLMYSRE